MFAKVLKFFSGPQRTRARAMLTLCSAVPRPEGTVRDRRDASTSSPARHDRAQLCRRPPRHPAARVRSRDTVIPRVYAGEPVQTSPYGVECEDLYVRYGDANDSRSKDALQGVSLRVPRGSMFMLLGPNGCGKSTLLRTFAGLVTPWSGRLRVQAPRAFVFQNPDHQVIMPTVGNDVAFSLNCRYPNMPPKEVAARVRAALSAVNLDPDEFTMRQVSTLSGGQKQRVAIAGALVENPRVLLLDELTTFLDEADQAGVVRAVRNVVDSDSRVTAIWVTHRLEELRHCDAACYMEDGRVAEMGSGDYIRGYIRQQQRQWEASRSRRRG